MWPRGCASLNKYCEKNDWGLCWNMCTPVIGFCWRYVFLWAILIFRTSSLSSLLPIYSATTWIISGQCKSAADSVKKHVGMPKEHSIAIKPYSLCCQYAGSHLMFFKTCMLVLFIKAAGVQSGFLTFLLLSYVHLEFFHEISELLSKYHLVFVSYQKCIVHKRGIPYFEQSKYLHLTNAVGSILV